MQKIRKQDVGDCDGLPCDFVAVAVAVVGAVELGPWPVGELLAVSVGLFDALGEAEGEVALALALALDESLESSADEVGRESVPPAEGAPLELDTAVLLAGPAALPPEAPKMRKPTTAMPPATLLAVLSGSASLRPPKFATPRATSATMPM